MASSVPQMPYRSGLADLLASSSTAWPISRPPCITPAITSVIGISTSCARASCRTDSDDLTPYTVAVVLARTSASGMPRPSRSPNDRFLASGELQLATRSPIPASPANVC